MIVIDAAALTEYLVGLPEIRGAIDSEIATDGERLIHAPEVVDPETLNALPRSDCSGACSLSVGRSRQSTTSRLCH